MPAPRIFISHSAKDDPKLLWQLHDALEQAGFRVLMDQARLDPGSEWRNELYTWIGRAHGAVILLSEAASRSDFVYFEMAELASRRWFERDLLVVPVLIPPVTAAVLRSPRFDPLDLGRLQAIDGSRPDAVARVVEAFAPLRERCSDTPIDRLTTIVSRELPRDDAALERAAQLLDAAVDGREDTVVNASFVARSLFHAAAEKIRDAVAEVAAGGMSRSQVKKVVDIAVPFWIDPQSIVELVREAARPAGPHRILLLTAGTPYIGRMYAHRAALQYPLKWAVIPVTDAAGDDFVGAVVSEIRAWFRSIDELLEEASNAEVDATIAATAASDPVVIILPAGTQVAHAAALRDRYPHCIFLCLIAAEVPQHDANHAVALEPRLERAREELIKAQYVACYRLVRNTSE